MLDLSLDKKNSLMFQNPELNILDFSKLGVLTTEDHELVIEQKFHKFQVGDALYYDPVYKTFSKAIASNTVAIEVCGVVDKVYNEDMFRIITEGYIDTDRYQYTKGVILYLSEVVPGMLMSVEPTLSVKQVAVQDSGGIQVNIKMGYFLDPEHEETQPPQFTFEAYTKEELDDIILNIKG